LWQNKKYAKLEPFFVMMRISIICPFFTVQLLLFIPIAHQNLALPLLLELIYAHKSFQAFRAELVVA
jgi:hypothetical protein